MRRSVLSLLFAAVVACSGSTATIGGDETADGGASSDGSSGGASDGSSGDGGGGGTDGPGDGTIGQDAEAPDGGSRVDVQITISQLTESCQPVVQPDPIQLQGTITIHNGTTGNIGPITFPKAAFLNPTTFQPIATFTLSKPASIPVIAAGTSASADLLKADNSAAPANQCQTLECGKSVIVEIVPQGPGVPLGLKLRTNPISVACVN